MRRRLEWPHAPEPLRAPPRRRWFRFSLRTLLLAQALAAIGIIGCQRAISWHRAREQARIEAEAELKAAFVRSKNSPYGPNFPHFVIYYGPEDLAGISTQESNDP